MRVCMVGLGHLGLPVSCAMVQRGHEVYGYDVDRDKVARYRQAKSGLYEPGIDETLAWCLRNGLHLVDDLAEAVALSRIIFIAVPTPSRPDGAFDANIVAEAVREVAEHLQYIPARAERADWFDYKVVAIISTVLPMTTRSAFYPILRQKLGEPSDRYGLCYNAQFIAMGSVIRDMLDPEFVLLGEYDRRSGDVLERFYTQLVPDVPILRMTLENAELVKMIYNTFIGSKIVLGNTIMEMCDKIPHTHCDVVREAISLATERIISPRYLVGGLGDGGECFLPDQIVYTETGPREIGEIMVGERVLGGDGRLHSVTRKYEREYKGEVCRVKARGLPYVYLTPDHECYLAPVMRSQYVVDGKVKRSFVGVENMSGEVTMLPIQAVYHDTNNTQSVGYYAVFPIPRDMGIEPPFGVTNEYVSLAGYYLAEGSLEVARGQAKRVTFSFHEDEEEYISEVEGLVAFMFRHPNTQRIQKDSKAISVRFGKVALARRLHLDFGKGAKEKFVPPWILYGDIKWGRLLLKGVWRGDGSTHSAGFSFSTISHDLVYGVSILLRRLRIPHTIKYHPDRVGKDGVYHQPAYDLCVANAAYIESLADIVDMPIKHPMQKKRYPGTIFAKGDFFYHKIDKIESITYEGLVYNLEVEDTEDYVTNLGWVHNCHPRDQRALRYLAGVLDLSVDPFGFVTDAREAQTEYIAGVVKGEQERTGLPVMMLGLTFKPESDLTTDSPSLLLLEKLEAHGIDCGTYDPLRPDLERIGYAIDEPRIYVLATAHEEFKTYNFVPGSVIVDPWRMLDEPPEGCKLRQIGVGA